MVLVPYLHSKNGPKILCKNSYKSFNYYEFPSSKVAYSDIPTEKNSLGENVISIGTFYDNFKKYVYDIADNAIKRIIREDLKGDLTEDKYKLINHFKPKEYEPYYNPSTNTLTILL